MSDKKGINISGSQISGYNQKNNFGIGIGNAGGVTIRSGGKIIAGKIDESQKKTLAETAAEIQQLLKQLEQSNSTKTTASKMKVATKAIEVVENNPTLKERVIEALKSAGTEAFKEAIDHPVSNILTAACEGWIEP